MNPYRIFIVEDQPVAVEGLLRQLSPFDNLRIVGTAPNGAEYLRILSGLPPDMLPDLTLLDLEMPVMGGLETLKQLPARCAGIVHLVLTIFEDEHHIFAAIQAGAMGYLLKDEPGDRIEAAIREVMEMGGAPMSPPIARKALRLLAPPQQAATENPLSERELEVLRAMANGLDYKEIAEKLFLSPKTIRTHITNLYRKLQVNSQGEAVFQAMKHRWL